MYSYKTNRIKIKPFPIIERFSAEVLNILKNNEMSHRRLIKKAKVSPRRLTNVLKHIMFSYPRNVISTKFT